MLQTHTLYSLTTGCHNDYIEVTLAEDLNTEAFKFRRLCGRLTSYDLHASGNIATVYYHTDDRSAASNLRGFKATFQAIGKCIKVAAKWCSFLGTSNKETAAIITGHTDCVAWDEARL